MHFEVQIEEERCGLETGESPGAGTEEALGIKQNTQEEGESGAL